MPRTSTLRPCLPLPIEICQLIASFLPGPALKAFSRCSKQSHAIAAPILYSSIKLSLSSCAGFKEGGSLHHIRGKVRHITLPNIFPATRDEDIAAIVGAYDLFPKVTSLHIRFDCRNYDEALIFADILSKLVSPFCFYNSLQSLDVEKLDLPNPEPCNAGDFPPTQIPDGGFETLYFSNRSDLLRTREDCLVALRRGPVPAFLIDVSISTDLFSFAEPESRHPAPENNAYPFLCRTSQTLTRLTITTQGISTPFSPNIRADYLSGPAITVYTALKYLSVNLGNHWLYQHYIEEWAHRFPNLEVLDVRAAAGMWSWRRDDEYEVFPRFTQLRVARLPWPRSGASVAYHMGKTMAMQAIGFWLQRGMAKLEEVRFVRTNFDTFPAEDTTSVCRVARKSGGEWGGWELEWYDEPDVHTWPVESDSEDEMATLTL